MTIASAHRAVPGVVVRLGSFDVVRLVERPLLWHSWRVSNYRNKGNRTVSAQAIEEELLRSIEEVEDRITVFRNRVRAVLASAQSDGTEEGSEETV